MTEERKQRKGSILDLFLIFLFLICILSVFFRWLDDHQEQDPSSLTPFSVVGVWEGIDPKIAQCVSVGEILYDSSGEPFGRIVSIQINDASVSLFSDGVYYEGAWDKETRCDLLLTLSFEGRKRGTDVLWKGTRQLLVGENLILYGKKAELKLRVRLIED